MPYHSNRYICVEYGRRLAACGLCMGVAADAAEAAAAAAGKGAAKGAAMDAAAVVAAGAEVAAAAGAGAEMLHPSRQRAPQPAYLPSCDL